MDTILLILFVTAGICGVLVISALIIYAVPVQFAVIYVREKGREESTVTVSWGPASCSLSRGARQRLTRVLFSGRMIWSRLKLRRTHAGRYSRTRIPRSGLINR